MSLKLTENLSAQLEQENPMICLDRQQSIHQVWQILSRERCRFPILIGEYGCGRTVFLRQLAQSLTAADAPLSHAGSIVVRRLNVDDLHLNSGKRFSERLMRTIECIQAQAETTLLILDELDGL